MEQRMKRGGGGDPFPPFGLPHAAIGRSQRQFYFHVAAFETLVHGETGGSKHLAHRQVVGVSDGPKLGETVTDGQKRQPLQEYGAQSMSMEPVIDGHGDFGLVWVSRMVGTGGDHAQRAVLPPKGDDCQTALRICRITERSNDVGRGRRLRKKPVTCGSR